MSWKLWIDDQLDDPNCPARHLPEGFVGAKSSQEAIRLVSGIVMLNLPEHVDFDHDLGDGDDSMVFLSWLNKNYDLMYIKPFTYKIHSANPVGAADIVSFMETWKKVYNLSNTAERFITCVAIRFNNIIWALPRPNRHHDVIRRIVEEESVSYVDAHGDNQGFLDNKNNYLTREQALKVAIEAKQLKPNALGLKLRELYSEDIW